MKIPKFLVLLVLIHVASATCDIDGEWTRESYVPNQTIKFEGSISPTSGFIYGYVENPLGDEIARIRERQVGEDFEFELDANSSWLNGTYEAHFYYTRYYNGTEFVECEPVESVTDIMVLKTNNSKTDVKLDVVLDMSALSATQDLKKSAIEVFGHTVTSSGTATGYAGLIPDISLNSLKLNTQQNPLTSVNMNLEMCPSQQEWMDAYVKVSEFLNNSYDDVIECNKMVTRRESEIQDLSLQLDNMTGQRDKRTRLLRECERREAGKIEYLPALIIFGIVGAVFLRMLQVMDEKHLIRRKKKPLPIPPKGIDPFKETENLNQNDKNEFKD